MAQNSAQDENMDWLAQKLDQSNLEPKFEYEDKMTFRGFSSILVIFLAIKNQGKPFLHLYFFLHFLAP